MNLELFSPVIIPKMETIYVSTRNLCPTSWLRSFPSNDKTNIHAVIIVAVAGILEMTAPRLTRQVSNDVSTNLVLYKYEHMHAYDYDWHIQQVK